MFVDVVGVGLWFRLEHFISVILSNRELSLELTFREIDFSFLIYLYVTEKLIQMEVILEENWWRLTREL